MLTYLLAVALIAVLILMAVWRRYLSGLSTLASLLAGGLLLIWMQNMGLLPGTRGPLSETRPPTLLDPPREPSRTP